MQTMGGCLPCLPKAPTRLLRICFDERILGAVDFDNKSTLANLREVIAEDEISGVPSNYRFLFAGAPVSRKQEVKRRAADCFPSLTIIEENEQVKEGEKSEKVKDDENKQEAEQEEEVPKEQGQEVAVSRPQASTTIKSELSFIIKPVNQPLTETEKQVKGEETNEEVKKEEKKDGETIMEDMDEDLHQAIMLSLPKTNEEVKKDDEEKKEDAKEELVLMDDMDEDLHQAIMLSLQKDEEKRDAAKEELVQHRCYYRMKRRQGVKVMMDDVDEDVFHVHENMPWMREFAKAMMGDMDEDMARAMMECFQQGRDFEEMEKESQWIWTADMAQIMGLDEDKAEQDLPTISDKERQAFLKLVQQNFNGACEKFKATPDLRMDRDCVLAVVQREAFALLHASGNLKKDKEIVLAAVSHRGKTISFAHDNLKNDKDVVLAAVSEYGLALEWVHDNLKKDKDVVPRSPYTWARYISKDKDVVLAAVSRDGFAIEFAHDTLKHDKRVMLAAVKQLQMSAKDVVLAHVNDNMSVKDIVLAGVKRDARFLAFAPGNLKNDKDVALTAAIYIGCPVNPGSSMKDVALALVRMHGDFLLGISGNLRADKDVVLAAVTQNSASLKYALGGLNQDSDCLKAAGLFEEETRDYQRPEKRPEKVTLSLKFSLLRESTRYATDFAKAMQRDSYLRHFKTFNPNTGSKQNCDDKLDYTSMDNPCRGTLWTCKFPDSKNATYDTNGNMFPRKTSCWRFAFRFHQQKSKESNGFMIQVEEQHGLGDGQKMETEMARELKLKVFRTYTNSFNVGDAGNSWDGIRVISKAVQEWYNSGCANADLENVFIGIGSGSRPKYEKL